MRIEAANISSLSQLLSSLEYNGITGVFTGAARHFSLVFMLLAALTDMMHLSVHLLQAKPTILEKKSLILSHTGELKTGLWGFIPPQFPYISYVFIVRLLRLVGETI